MKLQLQIYVAKDCDIRELHVFQPQCKNRYLAILHNKEVQSGKICKYSKMH